MQEPVGNCQVLLESMRSEGQPSPGLAILLSYRIHSLCTSVSFIVSMPVALHALLALCTHAAHLQQVLLMLPCSNIDLQA